MISNVKIIFVIVNFDFLKTILQIFGVASVRYAFVSPELVILLTTGPRRILFKPFYLKHLLDKGHAETANKDMYSIISCQFPPNITIIIKDGVGCGCGLQGGCCCGLQGRCRVWLWSPRRLWLWSPRRV